jgi:hypothetical protein
MDKFIQVYQLKVLCTFLENRECTGFYMSKLFLPSIEFTEYAFPLTFEKHMVSNKKNDVFCQMKEVIHVN